MKKLLLIDGNNLLHRVFWVHDTYAKSVSVPHLFLNSIKKYCSMFLPNTIYIAWDTKLKYGESNYRKTSHTEYKSTRDREKNAKIYEFESHVRSISESLGIKNIYPGVLEADDVIAWLCKKFNDYSKTIVSVDQDLLQLIDDNTIVYSPIKDKIIDQDNFEEVTKVPLKYFVKCKALMGDKSDNITGIPRVGHRRAMNILSEGSVKDKLSEDNYKLYCHNLDLVDLSRAFDFHPEEENIYEDQLTKLNDHKGDINKFKKLCEELNLKSILKSLDQWRALFFKNDFANRLEAFLTQATK